MDATIALPGSKSITNRALVLAALADAPTLLRAPLRARDTELMLAGLRAMGVDIVDAGAEGTDLLVTPGPLRGGAAVDCGLAGTVMRFLPPVAALARGAVTFDGDPRARERPLAPLVDGLRQLGVPVEDGGRGGLPLTVHGTGRLRGGAAAVDATASSQFVSGLLLSAPRFTDGLTLTHAGGDVPSRPHIDLTLAMLRARGVAAGELGPVSWRVEPGPIAGGEVDVEPDLSNAAPFLAAALVTGGEVRMPAWPAGSGQPGAALVDLLAAFGATVEVGDAGLTVRGGPLRGVDLDLHEVGELVPVLAAVAALADGVTRFRGVAHLRGHETDRLAALAGELGRLGGDVTETEDGLVIRPAPLHGGRFATYADHRLATAAAVVGLVVPGVVVEDVATTAKTLPGFVGLWTGLLNG